VVHEQGVLISEEIPKLMGLSPDAAVAKRLKVTGALVIALSTVSFQAVRAAHSDPVKALKYE